MYKHILHATDLNENHFSTCEKAKKIASHFNATLHIIHVIDTPASLQVAQSLGFAEITLPVKDDAQLVMRLLGEALNIPESQQWVEIGSTKEGIIKKIKALDCSLLIIGGHSPTLSEDVPCDVLTLR